MRGPAMSLKANAKINLRLGNIYGHYSAERPRRHTKAPTADLFYEPVEGAEVFWVNPAIDSVDPGMLPPPEGRPFLSFYNQQGYRLATINLKGKRPGRSAEDPAFRLALAAALPALRQVLITRYNYNACILAARLMIEVCKAIGYRARAYTARPVALNGAYLEAVNNLGRPAETAEDYAAIEAAGGKLVTFDNDPEEGDPAGLGAHVVVIAGLPRARWLIDLTIDQANRPAKGIYTAPLMVPLFEPLEVGGPPLEVHLRAGGVLLYYLLEDQAFRQANAWQPDRVPGFADTIAIYGQALAAVNRSTLAFWQALPGALR